MPKVVLVHGWSASSTSMHDIRDYLEGKGYGVADVWLSDYLSLDDDIRVADVARRMKDVMDGLSADLGPFYDMIVHSTGGLVARAWLTRYYPDGRGCPVKHLVMVAPANFGSHLAAAGKSFIGRVIKGWKNWFQSGALMLENLELGSEFQWKLAQKDLVSLEGGPSPFGPGKVLPFIIVGSRGHTSGMEQIADKMGSDGVVRPCAASLKVAGLTLTFANDTDHPTPSFWTLHDGAADIPLAILPNRNHTTITQPQLDFGTFAPQLGPLIEAALTCADADYAEVSKTWRAISEQTHDLADMTEADAQNPPDPQGLHRYLQVIVHVSDDQGYDVCDYFVEFYDPTKADTDEDTVILHRDVIKDVHTYSQNSSYRCFFVDRTALLHAYYGQGFDQVAMSVSAARLGDHVAYFNTRAPQDPKAATTEGHIVISTKAGAMADAEGEFLKHDRTHLIELIIPRVPIDDVFKLPPPDAGGGGGP
jgi:pimeloyl-ACP methyl ester carboxylesterase